MKVMSAQMNKASRLSCRPLLLMLLGVFLVFAGLVQTPVDLHAQPPHDSKGTEFWVAFMESFGGGGFGESSDMRLYLSADSATQVTITYALTKKSVTVNIPVSHQSVEVNLNQLFTSSLELTSVNRGVSSKTLHVLSESPITLYGVSVRLHSSDAFLGLPDDALTRRYVVLSYPNGYNFGLGQFPGYDQPSEFAVIATEDGTEVTVEPSAFLNGRFNLDPFTIVLNEGEVFFAQANLLEQVEQDVSGTRLRSTKPIAVFGGNRRTSVPTEVGNYRDHLVEQLPPLDAWGTGAIVVPHFEVTRGVTYAAVARIVAALDNTQWEIDGVSQPVLQAGQVVEIEMGRDPLVLTASQPVMVAQYEHSVGLQMNGQFEMGDPFMMLIPPPEQYDTAYAFQSITHELFTRHFINVVVPTNAITSVRLDGAQVVVNYRPVPGTPYSYAQIELSAGSHFVTCDSAFGLYAYGYGQANSYGYPGGTLFRKLVVDFQDPFISVAPSCGTVSGVAIDDRITDSGIDSCYVLPSGTSNATVNIVPFVSGSDSVFYSATLNDPYQDGEVAVKAIDSAGRSIIQRNRIPGFTVGATMMSGNQLQKEEMPSYNGGRVCREIELVNYGAFPHTIDDLVLTPSDVAFSISPAPGFVLAPGEKRIVEICYEARRDSVQSVVLQIGDSCTGRPVVDLTVHSIIDTLPPAHIGQAGECGEGVEIVFEEPAGKFMGIATVDLVEVINASATFNPGSNALPSSKVVMQLTPVDFREDMIYEVRMVDLAGNVLVIRDTVGGYTLAAVDIEERRQVSTRLGSEWATSQLDYLGQRCDSLLLTNYGTRNLVVSQIIVEQNLDFSIPPAQFPLFLKAGDSVMVAICMEGRFAGDQLDTLLIVDTCGRWERVPMKTPVDFGLGYGVDRCGQNLTIQAFAPSKRTFLTTPFPNPSNGGAIGVDIALRQDEMVTVTVLDMSGEPVLHVLRDVALKGGIHRLHFHPQDLESGMYFCRMNTASGETYVEKMMVTQ